MKILTILASHVLLAIPTHAQFSPVRLDVRQSTKTDSKGKTHDTKSQTRSLTITLQNTSKEPQNDLVVKYWFIGRDLKSKDLAVIKSGERKSSIPPSGKDMVESEDVSSTYTEAHSQVSAGKHGSGGKSGNPKVKKVEASGDKIAGYAVQVLKDGKIVAEAYSEPSYKSIAH